MERSGILLGIKGTLGMIVPVSISSTDGFKSLRKHLCRTGKKSWTLGFAERPSKLFSGVEKRLVIWLMIRQGNAQEFYFSRYHRWLGVLVKHIHRLIPDTGRYTKISDFSRVV